MPTCAFCDRPLEATHERDATDRRGYCSDGCRRIDGVVPETAVTGGDSFGEERDERSTAFFEVSGMHCASCERFVEQAVGDLEGVTDADASYASETLRIGFEPGALDERALYSRLQRWGYDAARRDRDGRVTADDDGTVPRLLIGVIFGMMTMVWYVLGLYPTYFGYEPIIADLEGLDGRYLLANIWLMSTIVMLYTGAPLLRGAIVAVQARRPNMDLLVSLAIVGAYLYSALAVLLGRTDIYFDITVMVVLVVTIGRHYERRIQRAAADLIGELTALRVDTARRHPEGEEVPVEHVDAGERLIVRTGERVPLDGTVIEGRAAIDESLLTGALSPREHGPGDAVAGGTIVTDEPIVIEVDAQRSSSLDRIVDHLWHIQSARPGAQQLASTLAVVFVPLVVAIASIATAVAWVTGSGTSTALLIGLTVLIVSCPCALGLATPLAIARGVKAAAGRGVVLTAASVVEVAPSIDTVVFDKTGTLTGGEFHVDEVRGADETLAFAAALEYRSSHPIAEAIADAAEAVDVPTASDVRRLDRGMAGQVDGVSVRLGDEHVFEHSDWSLPSRSYRRGETAVEAGYTPVYVGWNGSVRGMILLEDRPRGDWDTVLDRVSDRHEVIVLTGDDEPATQRFRASPHVDHVFAGVPPAGKAEAIRRLRSAGAVAMVGDGSNDAPALAEADFGIALQSGTELAADAADVVLLDTSLQLIPGVLDHAHAMRTRIRQNLGWAFFYNAVAIPVAAVGLLNPLIAAVAMAGSSILVVMNSARGFDIETEELNDDGRILQPATTPPTPIKAD